MPRLFEKLDEVEAELGEQTDRRGIAEGRNGVEDLNAQGLARMVEDGDRRFMSVPLPVMTGQKRVTEVRMGEKIALKQTAAADRCAVAQGHAAEPKAVLRVAGHWTVAEILFRSRDIPHALVADELDECGFGEQFEHEPGIREREFADAKAFSLEGKGHAESFPVFDAAILIGTDACATTRNCLGDCCRRRVRGYLWLGR